MTVPRISDAEFTALIAAPRAVLVMFVAAWCAPCRRAEAEAPQLAALLGERAAVAVADIDVAKDAALHADLRGVPSLALFRDGALVATRLGHWPAATLRQWFDDAMKGNL